MGTEASTSRGRGRGDVRRFSTSDGMIAVAAVAVGFGTLRATSPEADWGGILSWAVWPPDWGRGNTGDQVASVVAFAAPFAVSATVAALAMWLRGPRPAWRRLASRPGLMACLVPIPAWVFGGVVASMVEEKTGYRMPGAPGFRAEVFSLVASFLGGFAVAVSWATLVLARRWRSRGSWLDRLGIVIGLAWLLLAALVADSLFWQAI